MFKNWYNNLVNMLPSGCKHLILTDDRRCVDCGYQLPLEFQMNIHLSEGGDPIGFVLVNVNTNPNLAEVKELIADQVETLPPAYRFMIRSIPISEKQESRFKAYEVYRANSDKLVIQNTHRDDFFE